MVMEWMIKWISKRRYHLCKYISKILKSAYYAGGYPNDGYGVCTDVVAYALKEAGYDLMELVSNDIEIHGDMYDIEIPDQNIDFGRVKNLQSIF